MAPVLALDGPSRFYGKLAGASAQVLVLGAGDGLVAAALASRGHEVVAVEASPSLRAMVLERKATLARPERLTVSADDPRTLWLDRKFSLVLAPHQALGLARSPDELHALLSVVTRHLEAGATFAFDALNEAGTGDPRRPRGAPHLRERSHAIHALIPLRLSAATLDEALESVGLVARERFSDFNETPFAPDAQLQVVVAGRADDPST